MVHEIQISINTGIPVTAFLLKFYPVKNTLFRFFVFSAGLFISSVVFPGCGNDIKSVNAITHTSFQPLMTAKNIEVVFSDSGKIQAKLVSVLLYRYAGENPYMEFPKGFQVEIYDSAQRVETTISGQYGKRFEYVRKMEARGHVIVRNELKKQQLETEHLIWDENRRMIFADVPVKITTPDKVLYGDGMESNESFTWYRFTRVYGQMMVKKDSI